MEQAKDQVDQVTNIMRGNVDKIMEREGKLQDLENKAEQLQADSQQFQVVVVVVGVRVHLLTQLLLIENSHQSQEKSLVGEYENEARNNRSRVLLISIISPDSSLQSARIEERGERREERRGYPRHSKCQLDTMFLCKVVVISKQINYHESMNQ